MENGSFIDHADSALARSQDELAYFEALVERFPNAPEYRRNLENAQTGLLVSQQRKAAAELALSRARRP